jgi:hypothetical protein
MRYSPPYGDYTCFISVTPSSSEFFSGLLQPKWAFDPERRPSTTIIQLKLLVWSQRLHILLMTKYHEWMRFADRMLNGLGVLTAVVRTGNFAVAGKSLNMSQSGVSRAIARLEARLGIRLLERTTRTAVHRCTSRE